jgi:hypothetical protein
VLAFSGGTLQENLGQHLSKTIIVAI